MGKVSIAYREDVVAALDEQGSPLRAEVRVVLRTKGGKAVLNLASSWAEKTVVIVELPGERQKRRG